MEAFLETVSLVEEVDCKGVVKDEDEVTLMDNDDQ